MVVGWHVIKYPIKKAKCVLVGWLQKKRLYAEFSSDSVEITRKKSVCVWLIGGLPVPSSVQTWDAQE